MIVRKHHVALVVAIVLLVGAIGLHTCQRLSGSARVSSFNVNQYPHRTYEPERMFRAITELDSPIVAIQEIGDINKMRQDVFERMGPHWKLRNAARCNTRCVGYLYDSQRVEIIASRTHHEIELHPGARPAYEVQVAIDDVRYTLVNVHLKAGKKHVPTRLAQLQVLSKIVGEIRDRGDRVVVLGDFNSVGPDDRAALEQFSRGSGLSWATSVLECSHYYRGPGRCITTTLDHAFTTHRPRTVEEAGDCATVGCDPGGQCPTWRSQVSDHCPFVVQTR